MHRTASCTVYWRGSARSRSWSGLAEQNRDAAYSSSRPNNTINRSRCRSRRTAGQRVAATTHGLQMNILKAKSGRTNATWNALRNIEREMQEVADCSLPSIPHTMWTSKWRTTRQKISLLFMRKSTRRSAKKKSVQRILRCAEQRGRAEQAQHALKGKCAVFQKHAPRNLATWNTMFSKSPIH